MKNLRFNEVEDNIKLIKFYGIFIDNLINFFYYDKKVKYKQKNTWITYFLL